MLAAIQRAAHDRSATTPHAQRLSLQPNSPWRGLVRNINTPRHCAPIRRTPRSPADRIVFCVRLGYYQVLMMRVIAIMLLVLPALAAQASAQALPCPHALQALGNAQASTADTTAITHAHHGSQSDHTLTHCGSAHGCAASAIASHTPSTAAVAAMPAYTPTMAISRPQVGFIRLPYRPPSSFAA